jgi:radical SAM protein with 4Fe4S-binding SPASM domain
MLDIHFYMKAFGLKRQLDAGEVTGEEAFRWFEEWRSPEPVVYNIETTNICNMSCEMCPGPTRMTRPRVTMPMDLFSRVVDQLKPWTATEWAGWERFVEANYSIGPNDMGENHFFLYIIPKVLVLHGYGEPLLDRHIVERVRYVTGKGIPSYFSCNPWNITVDLGQRLFEAGLDYIKFSTDSADDFSIQQIRGKQANFSESYAKICRLLEIKEEQGYCTTVVITMLDLNKPTQQEDFRKLCDRFHGLNVYIYLKSQDQLWFEETGARTRSIHWLEPCQFPWTSMTVKSDGSAVQCVEDYNNEIILGDVSRQSLADIWNGESYRRLREDHLQMRTRIKCTTECDMHLVGEYPCAK